MFDTFTVAFFGHRYIDNFIKIERLLEEQIRKRQSKSATKKWWKNQS